MLRWYFKTQVDPLCPVSCPLTIHNYPTDSFITFAITNACINKLNEPAISNIKCTTSLYQSTTYDEHRSQTNVVAAGGVEQNGDGE